MRAKWYAGVVVLIGAAVAASRGDDPPKPAPTTNDLGKMLVNKVARVKEGDIVQISGMASDVALLESVLVECEKAGAEGTIMLTPGNATARRLYTDVPEKFDKRRPVLAEKLAETITVSFSIESSDADSLADIPPERIQARVEASLPASEKMQKRNVRMVSIGNGVYPTEARAKELGLTKDELAALFRSGLAADPAVIAANGTKVKEKLAAGKEVKVACPNGTELTLGVAKRPVLITDGVISDEKIKAGGAACQVWLPAGETYLVPVVGTGTGRVVVSRTLWEGKEITDLKVTFKDGKVTELTAKPSPGFERLQAAYKASGAGKDELGVLDVGVNPNVKLPAKSKDGLYMAAGMVTVCVGINTWAGGENKCPFGFVLFIRDATLTVDGAEVVKAGELKLK